MFNSTDHHRTPQFYVAVVTQDQQKKDISQLVSDRLISLSLADNRGFEADQLDLTLSDHDGLLAIPPRNSSLEVGLGWQGEAMIYKGSYVVDEVQYSGSPDQLTLRARSADLKSGLSQQKERSFHQKTVGDIVEQIATEHGLKSQCDPELASHKIPHLDQTNESDINLLTRLAENVGAVTTVKNGALLFFKAGLGKTASGKPLPEIIINRQSGDSFTFNLAESANYKAVRAYWHDTAKGERGEVLIDENSKITHKKRMTKGRTLKNGTVKGRRLTKTAYLTLEQAKPITSDNDQIKTIRTTYNSKRAAITGAKSAFDKLKRGVATFSLTLAYGNAELMPETPITLQGFKAEIDATNWIVASVTHNINDSGFTSQVELELKLEE